MKTKGILPDTKLMRSPLAVYSKLGDDMVIMNTENGNYHALNAVAATIFDIFSQPHTPDEVIEKLVQRYHVSEEQCAEESMDCIQAMLDKHVLQVTGPL